MKKLSFVLLLCFLLSFGMSIISSANEYVMTPRYNNASDIGCAFSIQNNVAYVTVDVIGHGNLISRINVKATLEKKGFLGLWWSDVEEWTATSTNAYDYFEFTKEIGSGTYRCNFEITVEGSGGSADVYTKELTATN